MPDPRRPGKGSLAGTDLAVRGRDRGCGVSLARTAGPGLLSRFGVPAEERGEPVPGRRVAGHRYLWPEGHAARLIAADCISSALLAQAKAASHAPAGKSAHCPVAVARSQECTANSAICWLATKDFGTRPIGRSISWLRSPACCQAARNLAAPARNAPAQSLPIPAAGASQSGRPPVAATVNWPVSLTRWATSARTFHDRHGVASPACSGPEPFNQGPGQVEHLGQVDKRLGSHGSLLTAAAGGHGPGPRISMSRPARIRAADQALSVTFDLAGLESGNGLGKMCGPSAACDQDTCRPEDQDERGSVRPNLYGSCRS